MKTGRKSLMVVGAVLSMVCSVAMAAPRGGPASGRGRGGPDGQGMGFGPRAQGQMAPAAQEGFGRLIRRLDLTDEQRTKIWEILSQARPDAQTAREAVAKARENLQNAVTSGATEEQIRSAATALGTAIGNQAALQAKTLAAAKAVLTDEQRAQLEQMQKNLPPLRQRVRDAALGRPGGGPQRMRGMANGPAESPAAPGPRRAGPGPLPLERIFKAADANKDGTLTMEELRAFEEARRGGEPQP
jgi:Spy/CpxP family protein refolding chaperone